MDPFAVAADVAAIWRPLTTAETSVATTLLGYASDMLRERLTTIDADIVAGDIQAVTAKRVVVFAVKRAMQNPNGMQSRSRSIDDYTTTDRYAEDCRGQLELTDEDLAPLTPTGSTAAFTISPYGYTHRAYIADWEATL